MYRTVGNTAATVFQGRQENAHAPGTNRSEKGPAEREQTDPNGSLENCCAAKTRGALQIESRVRLRHVSMRQDSMME